MKLKRRRKLRKKLKWPLVKRSKTGSCLKERHYLNCYKKLFLHQVPRRQKSKRRLMSITPYSLTTMSSTRSWQKTLHIFTNLTITTLRTLALTTRSTFLMIISCYQVSTRRGLWTHLCSWPEILREKWASLASMPWTKEQICKSLDLKFLRKRFKKLFSTY